MYYMLSSGREEQLLPTTVQINLESNQPIQIKPDHIDTFINCSYKCATFGEAFIDGVITENLNSFVPGKRFLDIGCGIGDWCYTAALFNAKTVDGFDIQEKIVKRAKQATAELGNIDIQVGNAGNMPYGDASFDVATSLFFTCNLSLQTFEKHFQELYRVLAPGGKAILLVPTDCCQSRLYKTFDDDPPTMDSGPPTMDDGPLTMDDDPPTMDDDPPTMDDGPLTMDDDPLTMDDDPLTMENNIEMLLSSLPKYPTTLQMNEAFHFEDEDEDDIGIYVATFAVDSSGDVFHVNNISQLTDCQPIWTYCDGKVFPNYFHSNQSIITSITSAGLHIDSTENLFTEKSRVAYNEKGPSIPITEECVKEPLALVYCISKAPNTDEPPY